MVRYLLSKFHASKINAADLKRGYGGFFNHPSHPYHKYFVKECKNNFFVYRSFKAVKNNRWTFQKICVFSLNMPSSVFSCQALWIYQAPLTAMERFAFNFFQITKQGPIFRAYRSHELIASHFLREKNCWVSTSQYTTKTFSLVKIIFLYVFCLSWVYISKLSIDQYDFNFTFVYNPYFLCKPLRTSKA